MPGAAIELHPYTLQAFSLILHELATNAVKYGALSQPGGRVSVRSNLDEKGCLRMGWRESGGPAVSRPATNGYGAHLIEASATLGLGGTVEFDFDPAGMRVEVIAPLQGPSKAD